MVLGMGQGEVPNYISPTCIKKICSKQLKAKVISTLMKLSFVKEILFSPLSCIP